MSATTRPIDRIILRNQLAIMSALNSITLDSNISAHLLIQMEASIDALNITDPEKQNDPSVNN